MVNDIECGPVVAKLTYRHPAHPSYAQPIRGNDNIDIGRSNVQRLFGIEDKTISMHHLRFHCVMFEDSDENADPVAPLVYVSILSSNPVILTPSASNKLKSDCTLTRDSGDVLLNHEDVLQLTLTVSVMFEALYCEQDDFGDGHKIRQGEVHRFAKQYEITPRLLGTGGNASVFVAVKQSTKRQFACKVVSLPNRPGMPPIAQQVTPAKAKQLEIKLIKKRENLAREYTVLKDLNHPNIISLQKVFCATYNIYILQELITGGDLLSYIDHLVVLSEPESAVIVRQLLIAVEYLHSNGIVHRDIKPENVLMTSWRKGARIVLTDFGQSRTLDDAKNAAKIFRMQSVVGTYGYTAPEVYKQMKQTLQKDQGYSKAIDIWSVGCIAGTLLSGEFMFSKDAGDGDADSQCWSLSFIDNNSSWRNIGRKAKSFVKGCLEVDETKRLTGKQALLHEWFTNKYYAAELEAAYQRAIADWKPRKQAGNSIEFIDTSDVLSAAARPGHVKKGEKSRHFPPPTNNPPAHMTSVFSLKPYSMPPPQQQHKPVAEDAAVEEYMTPHHLRTQEEPYASPARVPTSPPQGATATGASTEQLSVMNYAPPGAIEGPRTTADFPRPENRPQPNMLDDFSVPQLPNSVSARLTNDATAASHKRAASFAGYGEVTQYTSDLDVAQQTLHDRKRVCY